MSFKTGYTGDIDGAKAQYKVEVLLIVMDMKKNYMIKHLNQKKQEIILR